MFCTLREWSSTLLHTALSGQSLWSSPMLLKPLISSDNVCNKKTKTKICNIFLQLHHKWTLAFLCYAMYTCMHMKESDIQEITAYVRPEEFTDRLSRKVFSTKEKGEKKSALFSASGEMQYASKTHGMLEISSH